MKSKVVLLFLLFLIMAAGARTMFEIAYHGAGREHDFAPASDTAFLIFLALWFVLMMIADVLLLNYKQLRFRNLYIALLSASVIVPILYMYFTK